MALRKYRADIDGLRCLAVVPVVLNHAGVEAFPGGFIGVDIFFVISGFLITRILLAELDSGTFSIVGFYERRARRILPALTVVILSCLTAGWFLLLPGEYASLAKSALSTLVFSSNIWFWRVAGDYFGAGVVLEPLMHTWSLAVEEQFYVFFPLLLALVGAASRARKALIIALLSLISFLFSLWATEAAPTANFYLLPSRIWELGLGAILATGLLSTVKSRVLREVAAAVGLISIVAGNIFINDAIPFPGAAALPACLGTAAIIWAGSQDARVTTNRLLSWAPFVWLGLISYSLYLWHWPVLVAVRILGGSLTLTPTQASVSVFVSIMLGWLSWRFVEGPFRRSTSEFKLNRSAIFRASGWAYAVIALSAIGLLASGGASSRVEYSAQVAYATAIRKGDVEQVCMSRPVGRPCTIGAEKPGQASQVDLVLWGDSHAGALLGGLDPWMKEQGLSGYAFTKAACAPVLGVRRADRGLNHRCDEQNEAAMRWIEELDGNAPVVIFGRWALVVEGSRPPGEAGQPAILAPVGGTNWDISQNAAFVRSGLEEMVTRLKKSGHEPIFVSGIPFAGTDVPKHMLRHALFQRKSKLENDLAAFEVRNARADDILLEISRGKNVALIRSSEVFCVGKCVTEINGKAIYRDDDHLSIFGARKLVGAISDQFSAHIEVPRLNFGGNSRQLPN